MDEVFGRKNFVANVIWQKKFSPQNDAKWLSDSHDHILIFAKCKDQWRANLLPRTEAMDARYRNPDNDPRGLWTSGDLSVKTYNANTDYPITTPSGRIVNPPSGYCWRFSKEKLAELIECNRISFGKNGSNVPRLKRFLSEVQGGLVSKTIWLREEVGDNQDAKREIKSFNMNNVFATPKPEKLLKKMITIGTNEGDLVLDSFLGSGTTAAVAQKMGRRYIGIEMGEHAVTHCVPRLKKVIEGEEGGISKAVAWKGGGGFRFYRLGEAIFDEDGRINPKVRFPALAAHVWFTETGIPYEGKGDKAFLGVHESVGYALLYNGILGDKRINGGNVLTRPVLKRIDKESDGFAGPLVVYGEMSRISESKLREKKITFKQTPYDVRAR